MNVYVTMHIIHVFILVSNCPDMFTICLYCFSMCVQVPYIKSIAKLLKYHSGRKSISRSKNMSLFFVCPLISWRILSEIFQGAYMFIHYHTRANSIYHTQNNSLGFSSKQTLNMAICRIFVFDNRAFPSYLVFAIALGYIQQARLLGISPWSF